MIAGYVNGVNKDLLVGGQAANVGYDNTVSGLTATDTQGAIDELSAEVNKGYVEVIADGVKTASQLLDALYALADTSKITFRSVLIIAGRSFSWKVKVGSVFYFDSIMAGTNNMNCGHCDFKSSGSVYGSTVANVGGSITYSNNSSNVPSSGAVYTLYY